MQENIVYIEKHGGKNGLKRKHNSQKDVKGTNTLKKKGSEICLSFQWV